jgi:hypothetical protein
MSDMNTNNKKRKIDEIGNSIPNWWNNMVVEHKPLALKMVQECEWDWEASAIWGIGKNLHEDLNLADYNIEKGSTIHQVFIREGC